MPKPIAGYPSRTAACLALNTQGLTTLQIATRLGLETTVVSALLCSKLGRTCGTGQRRGKEPPHENGGTIVVSIDVLTALRPHAARRGVTVHQIVGDILASVVDDRIVDAALHDAADLAPQPRQVSA